QQQTVRETEVTDTEVERLRAKLSDLDSRIENYKQSAVEELPERADANLKEVATLRQQYQDKTTAINNDQAKQQGDIQEMKDIEQKGMLNPPADAVVKSTNQIQLDAAQAKLDALRTRYTSNNREVLLQEEQVQNLEKLVAAEPHPVAAHVASPAELRYTQLKAEVAAIDKHLLDLRQDRSSLSSQLVDSQRHVNATPRHEQALAQLTREYEITKTEYQTQLQKQLDVRRDEQLRKVANNGLVFRIVEPAQVPLDPVSPKRIRILAMGLVAGIAFGLGTAFLAEHIDSSFKDVDEFQNDTGLTVLSIIPRLNPNAFPQRPRRSKKLLSSGDSDAGAHPVGTIVTVVDPQSVASEQFQILAMRMRNSVNGTKCPTILVTSSAGGEGKTVTSINLALALSEQSHVLLIDADMRRPKVHEYLGFDVREGRSLGDLLFMPEDGLAKYTRTVQGLTVIAGGDHVKSPLPLLTSSRLKVLMSRLREKFDFIVIDSPPIIPVADGIILSRFADHVALVVRAGHTPRAVLRRALDSLDTSQLAGVVLNDVDTKRSRYAYAYKYYQASDRHES
ncbi:MAG TPA: polysaccharide biosynthesis tyrosine autokinase, partial [Terriglobia bacterium]|nr:polysaccharide biosynthesis tyrosine autokinase [Terriglobia bacterium]